MNTITQEKLSKTMSHALRHAPEVYSLTLTPEGFIPVEVLAQQLSAHFKQEVTETNILSVVAQDSKQRFTVRGPSIRAAQGHSFPVQLGLVPVTPPEVLYHGTVAEFVPSIMKQGLIPGSRQLVHMSAEFNTAVTVGSRRGKPVILTVNTAAAVASGVEFFQSENQVWLAHAIPPEFITAP
jgi:putative RNA 2'-phosphotransferase